MTFNPSVPLNSDSPSIFPTQNQTNMGRLQTIIGADHQFNLSASADDGYHNLVHLTQQAPSGVLAAVGRVYAKSSAGRIHEFYMDDTGAEYQITPAMPIRAAVNFNGLGAATIRSQYNVASVDYVSTGRYKINFTTPMPDANYIVQVTGMRNGSGNLATTCIEGNATYSASVDTTFVRVNTFNNAGGLNDMLMVNVTIFSVT